MRAVLSFCAILLSLPASADSNMGKLGQIAKDIIERGLTPAHITIEYSLTDECSLTGLRVIENSNPDALGPDVVDEVVKVMIGPFSGATPSDELIQFSTDGESPPMKLSMNTRMISWNTKEGYRYVVCQFYSDGELESARHIDGHGYWYKQKIQDRVIEQALSEMEAKTKRVSFVSEDN